MNSTITQQDLEFVKLLMRSNSDSVGFIPLKGVERAVKYGGLISQKIENERVGYLIHGPLKPFQDVYIWQECIDKDVRRMGIGRNVFFKLYKKAVMNNAKGIKLRCADDLISNIFWESMGFQILKAEEPNNRRKRKVNNYYLKIFEDNDLIVRGGKILGDEEKGLLYCE